MQSHGLYCTHAQSCTHSSKGYLVHEPYSYPYGCWNIRNWAKFMSLSDCLNHYVARLIIILCKPRVFTIGTYNPGPIAPREIGTWTTFPACVTPLTSCTVESEIPDLGCVSVAFFWWCTIVNWASVCMLWYNKKQHKPYSCLWLWITSMADISETVQLSQVVRTSLTQPYTLGGRFRCFLFYIATVPHLNLYVILNLLKVNFLQFPSTLTKILHKKRSCWYRSTNFRLSRQIPVISPTEIVYCWWKQNDKCHPFLFYQSI